MAKKLVDIMVDKVASVDKAANKRKWLIIKRQEEPEDDHQGTALDFLKYMESEEAKDFNTAYSNNKNMHEKWKLDDALRESINSIIEDNTVEDKRTAISQTLTQYMNELLTSGIVKAATKTEGGQKYPAKDYAYVPDAESPSTWKLRLTSTPGGAPDTRIVGAAVAALGPGFRGQKVQIPAGDLAGVKSKVKSAWLKANPSKTSNDLPQVLKKGGDELMNLPSIEEVGSEFEAVISGIDAHIDEINKSGGSISKEMKEIMSHMQKSIGRISAIGKKESDNMPITDEVLKGLPDEVQKHVSDQTDKIAELTKQSEELTAKVEELSKQEKPAEEDIWKGVNPKVKEEFETMQKKVSDAEELAKTEHETRIAKQYADEAKTFPHIGSVEDVAKMLRSADEQDEEIGKKLRESFSAAEAKIKANDKLTKELGKSIAVDEASGAWNKIESLAKELVSKTGSKITQEDAINKVLETKEGQELYNEYLQEGSVN